MNATKTWSFWNWIWSSPGLSGSEAQSLVMRGNQPRSTSNTHPFHEQTSLPEFLVSKFDHVNRLEQRISQLETLVKQLTTAAERVTESTSVATNTEDANTGDQDKDAKPRKVRYRDIVRTWNEKSGMYEEKDAGEPDQEAGSKEFAYTFRRTKADPEEEDDVPSSEVDLEDRDLVNLIKSVVSKYPGVNFESDPVTITEPFGPIVHNWDALQRETNNNTAASEDLAHLLKRLEQTPELGEYFKTRQANERAKVITWKYLWTLFPPGQKVVWTPSLNKKDQVFLISNWQKASQREHSFLLSCYDWDGEKMITVFYWFAVTIFPGTKPINQLSFYPLTSDAKFDALRGLIMERSRKYLDFTQGKDRSGSLTACQYDGLAQERTIYYPAAEAFTQQSINSRPKKAHKIKGQIISDAKEFTVGGTPFPIGSWVCSYYSVDTIDHEGEPSAIDWSNPSDDSLILLPPRILGYATREKIWAQFDIDNVTQVAAPNRQKFDEQLQLDKEQKNLILALVNNHHQRQDQHTHQRTQINDIIEEKGQGLVFLFHGGPGVGKTLTAETISEATGKPLYLISVADIGPDPSKAEVSLKMHFDLATRWQAILLIDEADVFLESRETYSNESRNALVSVLLRVLEYYRGIVILTTNRIKAIDIAVLSRIHLAVHYTDIKEEGMINIFNYFLDQIKEEEIEDRKAINDYIKFSIGSLGFNGRQIRNVVSAALAKAKYDEEGGREGTQKQGRLTQKDLETVTKRTKEFQKLLQDRMMIQKANREV